MYLLSVRYSLCVPSLLDVGTGRRNKVSERTRDERRRYIAVTSPELYHIGGY